ncbi:family 88-like protein (plasmid) [Borrelia recurrentis A1]|uniref:Family 88-like protein n=1 Tax=Borrelia recurrentis (strain A1) TaxID=412418 RepID=B5RS37_BORRA|nr:family 88-like protein [Borrelia recurrentis A1]
MLSSGIPLSQFTKKNFTITNYTHDTITYTSSSNLQIKNHTLVNSTLIINAIYFLKKHKFNIIYIKLNRILKKLFRTNITTKHLEYIYSIILQSLNKKDNSYFYESILHFFIKKISNLYDDVMTLIYSVNFNIGKNILKLKKI